MKDIKYITYTKKECNIVENGIDAIKKVLLNNSNENDKLNILFCLDKYLDPYFKYNLPYEEEIFKILQEIIISENTLDTKEEAINLLSSYSWPPFKIIEKNIDKIEKELISDIKYLINMDKLLI